jgi:hypothetical protein
MQKANANARVNASNYGVGMVTNPQPTRKVSSLTQQAEAALESKWKPLSKENKTIGRGAQAGIQSINLRGDNNRRSFVGNVLIDNNKLLANADVGNRVRIGVGDGSHLGKRKPEQPMSGESVREMNECMKRNKGSAQSSANKFSKVEKKKELDFKDEVAALLGRKSSHADEAQEEWFEDYKKRMDKAAKKEAWIQKEAKITTQTVRAFHCQDCKLTTERYPDLCRQKGHKVMQVSATKRYFECGSCRQRDYTLAESQHSKPSRHCSKCGDYNWVACGKVGSGDDGKPLTDRMVTSASEWSSRKEIASLRTMNSGV